MGKIYWSVDGNDDQGGVGRWVGILVFLVRSCLLVTLIKCLKGPRSLGSLFVSQK